FLRHGEADWPDWKKSDDERPLTKRGKKEMHEIAAFLVRLKVRPNLILTSPLPRAAQTAEIAAEHLEAKCREDRRLAPGFGPAARWSMSIFLRARAGCSGSSRQRLRRINRTRSRGRLGMLIGALARHSATFYAQQLSVLPLRARSRALQVVAGGFKKNRIAALSSRQLLM